MTLLATLPVATLAWMAAGLFVAAFSRGYSGFGFSALLVGSWSLVLPPARAVAAAVIFEVMASCLQARAVWRDVAWRRVLVLTLGALVGNAVGIMLLFRLPAQTLRLAVAGVMIVGAASLLAGYRRTTPTGRGGEAGIGVASGLVNGTTAMGGLPIALFFVADGMTPAAARAAFVAYFFATDLFAAGLLFQRGVVDAEMLTTIAFGMPLLALGVWLGGKHFLGATPEEYRRFNLFLLIALALAVLTRTLLGW